MHKIVKYKKTPLIAVFYHSFCKYTFDAPKAKLQQLRKVIYDQS